MRIVVAFCVLLPALVLAADDKVNVTVFYESLCPDSQKFFNNQLFPAYNTPLATYMNLMLVPYGNAKTSAAGVITCQHGEVECYGNRIHACAIKLASPDNSIKFINCLMAMAFKEKPLNTSMYQGYVATCAANHSMTDNVTPITTCANGTESDPLMELYGNLTKNANPPIKGVPTTFFNSKSSKEINDNASKDFAKELCTFITTKPHECKSGKGSASDIAGSVLLVTSALLLSRFH